MVLWVTPGLRVDRNVMSTVSAVLETTKAPMLSKSGVPCKSRSEPGVPSHAATCTPAAMRSGW